MFFCRRALLTLLVLAAGFLPSGAQQSLLLSDSARITLLTADPGEELYSTFGHSALRVRDPLQRIDRCFNYGTFEFDQPNFYGRFLRGKLLYFLNVESFRSISYGYLVEQRNVREQTLQLDPTQKQRLFDLLRENARPENSRYKYDFFYDNCATRIRDVVAETFFQQLYFDSTALPPGVTMRQLLRPYLADKPWTQFGIDLVLGLPADKKATVQDFMFLPDGLHDIFARTQIDQGISLIESEQQFPNPPFPKKEFQPTPFDRPWVVTVLVALIGIACMFVPKAERIFDVLFWMTLGLAGVVITFLWFFTDHSATKTNFNLFWALPTHLFFFWRRQRSEWTENYFTGAALLAGLMLIVWFFLPQEMPVAAIPIVVLIVVKGLWRRNWTKDTLEEEQALIY